MDALKAALVLLCVGTAGCGRGNCPPMHEGYLDRLGLGVLTNIPTLDEDGSQLCGATFEARLKARFPDTWTGLCWTSGRVWVAGEDYADDSEIQDLGGAEYQLLLAQQDEDDGWGPELRMSDTVDGERLLGEVVLRCSPGSGQPADFELHYCVRYFSDQAGPFYDVPGQYGCNP